MKSEAEERGGGVVVPGRITMETEESCSFWNKPPVKGAIPGI